MTLPEIPEVTPSVVLGELDDGGVVTLPAASLIDGQSRRVGGDSAIYETWTCELVFLDVHWPAGLETPLDAITLESEALTEWTDEQVADHSFIHADESQARGGHTINVRLPDSIEVVLRHGTLSLWWRDAMRFGRSVEIDVTPCWHFRPEQATDYETLWRDVAEPMVYFMSLMTGGADLLTRIEIVPATADDDEYTRRALVLNPMWMTLEPTSRTWYSWAMPVPLQEVRDNLSSVIEAWFELARSRARPLSEFFSVLLARSFNTEDAFNRLVRALETWHRLHEGGTHLDPRDFDALLAKVQSSVSPDEWQFLQDRLRYANELSLKSRLDDLLAKATPPLPLFVKNFSRFTRRVVVTRNFMAHGTRDPLLLTSDQQAWARPVLELLMVVSIWRAIGLGDDLISQALQRWSGWRTVIASSNPLLA